MKDYGPIDAYLIEARSIGGLSESPVFVNLGGLRSINGSVTLGRKGPAFLLLGLIHDHFDTDAFGVDIVEEKDQPDNVNTGIAVVVPYPRIEEVFAFSEKNLLTPKDEQSA